MLEGELTAHRHNQNHNHNQTRKGQRRRSWRSTLSPTYHSTRRQWTTSSPCRPPSSTSTLQASTLIRSTTPRPSSTRPWNSKPPRATLVAASTRGHLQAERHLPLGERRRGRSPIVNTTRRRSPSCA